jgi:para-nitrobenzyl esterase
MHRFRLRLAVCAVQLFLVAGAVAGTKSEQFASAHLASGELRGTVEAGLRVFRGLPYAAPPTGPLRWRPPQPPPAWSGVRDASRFGPTCPQTPQGWVGIPRSAMSEDCLSLNVFTPAQISGAQLPVLVWIHGGGFQSGGSAQPGFDARPLARHGLVLVTLNYRLGVLGFLAHPQLSAESPHHSSGNYGLLDQIAALHWVQANIAAFGGDPQNVTIAGESAGGTSVGYLLASPLARGLFARAITESASRLFTPDPDLSSETPFGLTPMEEVGAQMDPSIAHLRSLPTWELMSRAEQFTERFFGPNGPGKLGLRPEGRPNNPQEHDSPWWAFVDGWVIPEPLDAAAAHHALAPVPLLAGTNTDEGSVFSNTGLKTAAEYKRYLQDNFNGAAGDLFALYPAADETEIRTAIRHIITDAFFLYGTVRLAEAEKAENAPAFLYLFPPPPAAASGASGLGAYHGAEIPYVFGFVKNGKSATPQDKLLADAMMSAWTNFARGFPPEFGGAPWPAAGDKARTDILTLPPRLKNALPDAKLAVFQRLYSRTDESAGATSARR